MATSTVFWKHSWWLGAAASINQKLEANIPPTHLCGIGGQGAHPDAPTTPVVGIDGIAKLDATRAADCGKLGGGKLEAGLATVCTARCSERRGAWASPWILLCPIAAAGDGVSGDELLRERRVVRDIHTVLHPGAIVVPVAEGHRRAAAGVLEVAAIARDRQRQLERSTSIAKLHG